MRDGKGKKKASKREDVSCTTEGNSIMTGNKEKGGICRRERVREECLLPIVHAHACGGREGDKERRGRGGAPLLTLLITEFFSS